MKLKSMLKILLFIPLCLAQSWAQGSRLKFDDKPSVHGMLIVGTEKIYLSHLPMFHSPHDYQVLLEAELSKNGRESYLKNFKSTEKIIYTLVPETFVLPEMVQNPRPFKASIYKGHFERGGKAIADNVTVTITKVILFRKFFKNESKPLEANYLIFGNSKEQFMAHFITKAPDYDSILKINAGASVLELLAQKKVVPVNFLGKSNLKPFLTETTLEGDLPEDNSQKTSITILSNIYTEFDDLEM